MGECTSSERQEVVIYTDGACQGNPGPGGWAAVLRQGRKEQVLSGGASNTTNNRMELRAAIEALRALGRPTSVRIYTDSQYLRLGISEWLPGWQRNGWRTVSRQRVKNQDLWKALVAAQKPHVVEWHWVKGHSGDRGNARVDFLARQAMADMGRSSPPDQEPVAKQLGLL